MSMQRSNKHFALGSHLIVKRFGYTHHGIYAGRGKVIHYSGLAHFYKKHPIEMTTIDAFSRGKRIYVRRYEHPKYHGKMVVRRMRSRMHENHYDLIINNCEHLCTWAITGVESSRQVERLMQRLTTIGYISSIMTYMNTMMLTLATTSFALVLLMKKKLKDREKMKLPVYLYLKQQSQQK